jgi:uncharacterized OB-fold protein
MGKTYLKCENCGKKAVEETPQDFYCLSCGKRIKKEERAVHHEGFPHVVTVEQEP